MRHFNRKHFLSSGDALDRRLLQELFLEAANRARQVLPDNVADQQFGRGRFEAPVFEEYWYDFEDEFYFKVPPNRQVVPGTFIRVENSEPFFVGEFLWSMEIDTFDQNAHYVWGVPVFEGRAMWDFMDVAMSSSELGYSGLVHPYTVGDSQSPVTGTKLGSVESHYALSGGGGVVGFTGRLTTGVLVGSVGSFQVRRAQAILRSRSK